MAIPSGALEAGGVCVDGNEFELAAFGDEEATAHYARKFLTSDISVKYEINAANACAFIRR